MYLIKAPYIVLTPCKNSHRKAWRKDNSWAAAGGMEQEEWSSTLAAAGVAGTDARWTWNVAAAGVAAAGVAWAYEGVACCTSKAGGVAGEQGQGQKQGRDGSLASTVAAAEGATVLDLLIYIYIYYPLYIT